MTERAHIDLAEVKSRTSLVGLVARSVALKRKGRDHWGLCPFHGERTPSFKVDERRGTYHCFGCDAHGDALSWTMWAANCDFRTALEELAIDCGLLQRDGHAPVRLTPKIARPDEAALAAERGESMRWAAQVWRDARPAAGTPVETYLRARGITLAVPASLRFAPSLKYGPDGRHFPAMVAGVQDAAGAIVGVHRTYLRADGRRKADVERPKRMGGACWGGAVRFAKPAAELGIAEGIESALSVMQATGLPCWAALSLGNQRAIALPAVVTSVVLLADQDELDIDKHDKLRDAAALHHRAHGRAVRIAKPPRGKDFNDLIREGAEVSA